MVSEESIRRCSTSSSYPMWNGSNDSFYYNTRQNMWSDSSPQRRKRWRKHLSRKELKRAALTCWMCGDAANLNNNDELPASLRRSIAALCDQSTLKVVHDEPLVNRGSLLYEKVLKDFLLFEEQYIRELNLIIKVFRQPFLDASHIFTKEDVDKLFGNIVDIYEFTIQFYSMLEAALEMGSNDRGTSPLIGDCFEELAEGAEFEVYDIYAKGQVAASAEVHNQFGIYTKVQQVLTKPGAKKYFQDGELLGTLRYVLPRLLYSPIYHMLEYFDYMKLLIVTTPDDDDREKIDSSRSALLGLKNSLKRMCSSEPLKRQPKDEIFCQRRFGPSAQDSIAKMKAIQESIVGWEGKGIHQVASVYIKEGLLTKPAQAGKKATTRKVFLFDSLMVCTKQKVRQPILSFRRFGYRLKEKISLHKAIVKDMDDKSDAKHCFQLIVRDSNPIVFSCESEAEKYEWLAVLTTLQYRSTLDRTLDAIQQEEEQQLHFCTPDPSSYRFAEPDSDLNIVFEEGEESDSGVPVIRGGTLFKLIERLTYHEYAAPTFVREFLTTYRSFSTPGELLSLLIMRYNIPEPPPTGRDLEALERGITVVREDLKRFRKEYSRPIQLRVLNVLRHWVDQHFYDFQREEELLAVLRKFLSKVVQSKSCPRKWVDTIEKIVNRRLDAMSSIPDMYTFAQPPPEVEWHLTKCMDQFNILTLHPLEIARQLTLYQSEMFRSIKPSELVGSVWTKSEREKLSPNALKMVRFSTSVTLWYEKSILEAENFEERVAVYNRILEILAVFHDLNNFNGMLEVLSAIDSSPVHRLKLTAAEVHPKRQQTLQITHDLAHDHCKKYQEKLRSINPPCIPFLGVYLSNILKIEEGSPDFLSNTQTEMINFSKRRMVADITGEIQQYQNVPYNLRVEPTVRRYLETLDPLEGRSEKEMNDYLYETSLIIEPRKAKQPPKFSRKSDISLKSPGIKPSCGKSTPSYRKFSSSSCLTDPSTPTTEHRPSSPTLSAFSVFTVDAVCPLGSGIDYQEEEDRDCLVPPPEPLPRSPLCGLPPPGIPEKSRTVKSRYGRSRSDSLPQLTRRFPMFGVELRQVSAASPPPRHLKAPLLSSAMADGAYAPARVAKFPAVVRKTIPAVLPRKSRFGSAPSVALSVS